MSGDPREYSFLSACHALVQAERELVPQLAETLGVAPREVFYSWMDRSFPNVVVPPDEGWRLQVGQIRGGEWQYYFHGLECELANRQDGRHLRVEFGPHGRYDLLSAPAVLQFVLTGVAPWPEFPELKAHLAGTQPPSVELANHDRVTSLWTRLETQGYLVSADPALETLVGRSTVHLPSGCRQIRLPDELTDRERLDCMVCQRRVLSEAALQLLGEGAAP